MPEADEQQTLAIKTLRRQKNELEDELDGVKEERDAAVAGKKELEQELANLRQALHEQQQQEPQQQQQQEQRGLQELRQVVERLEEQLRAEKAARALDAQEVAKLQSQRDAVEGELQLARGALSKAKQEGAELQAEVEAMQSAHEALFSRYSGAVEQLDSLKTEKRNIAAERDSLRASLQEERAAVELAHREREEAEREAAASGPAQLSVSDVLISVVFDGVPPPLQLRPWDTNLEDVVRVWLAEARRNSMLQPSLVRYLQHLEDTTQAFPVRVEAKLLEVHEQFAM